MLTSGTLASGEAEAEAEGSRVVPSGAAASGDAAAGSLVASGEALAEAEASGEADSGTAVSGVVASEAGSVSGVPMSAHKTFTPMESSVSWFSTQFPTVVAGVRAASHKGRPFVHFEVAAARIRRLLRRRPQPQPDGHRPRGHRPGGSSRSR